MTRFPLSICVRWPAAVEIIEITPSVFRGNGQVKSSNETWLEEGKAVNYITASQTLLSSAAQIILEIDYSKARNQHLEDVSGVWGKSRIVFEKGAQSGKAYWHENAASGRPAVGHWWSIPQTSARKRVRFSRAERQQQRFRLELLRFGQACVITEETTLAALEAAHVLSVEVGGPEIPQNGFFLRADLHRLFDEGLFDVNPSGKLVWDRSIGKTYIALLRKKQKLDSDLVDRIRNFLHWRSKARTSRSN